VKKRCRFYFTGVIFPPHFDTYQERAEPMAEKSKRNGSRAREIYTEQRGRIPGGRMIHHIDGNPGNDDISNLACVSTKEHGKLHKAMGTYKNGAQAISRVYGTEPDDFVWVVYP